MCLNAARLPARIDSSGDLHALFDQDRSQWDRQLVSEGLGFLEFSAVGSELTEYHVEAGIAAAHAQAARAEETDWKLIVSLYDTLMTLKPSPIVALNRAIAIAQNEGPERGLEEIQSIGDRDRLVAYPFYFAALGELQLRCGKRETARRHFSAAFAVARNPMERRFLSGRIAVCEREATP
jgi:RNA polymerase sigma-70 factor (ECF subfamily)